MYTFAVVLYTFATIFLIIAVLLKMSGAKKVEPVEKIDDVGRSNNHIAEGAGHLINAAADIFNGLAAAPYALMVFSGNAAIILYVIAGILHYNA